MPSSLNNMALQLGITGCAVAAGIMYKCRASSKVKQGSSNTKPLLVIGSINADIYVEINTLPKPGETLMASDTSGYVLPGGKGANQAVAAGLLSDDSIPVEFCGVFGNDSHATMLHQAMKGYGIGLGLSQTADVPTGQAYILLQAGGENSIILVGGANQAWPLALPAALSTAIEMARGVMLQREIPPRINLLVAQAAAKARVPVFMDVGGADTDMNPEIFPYLFMLAPNETELARLTGLPTTTTEEAVAAAKALQQKGVQQVLVTMGSNGSLLLTPSGDVLHQGIIKARQVVDTTGAGDCFRAAFTVAHTSGQACADALTFAAQAASLCVTAKGAMPSMPKRATVTRELSLR